MTWTNNRQPWPAALGPDISCTGPESLAASRARWTCSASASASAPVPAPQLIRTSGAGFTNDFLINTRHPNAIIYNDRSVNENFHVSCAFRLAQLPETNIFEGLSRQEFVQV